MGATLDRGAFEKWLDEVMGLQSEWQPERNCYKEFAAHLAWKAWCEARKQAEEACEEKHADDYDEIVRHYEEHR